MTVTVNESHHHAISLAGQLAQETEMRKVSDAALRSIVEFNSRTDYPCFLVPKQELLNSPGCQHSSRGGRSSAASCGRGVTSKCLASAAAQCGERRPRRRGVPPRMHSRQAREAA